MRMYYINLEIVYDDRFALFISSSYPFINSWIFVIVNFYFNLQFCYEIVGAKVRPCIKIG